MLLTDSTVITNDNLRLGDLSPTSNGSNVASVVKIPPTGVPLEEIERQAVVEALTMSNWVQKDAAKFLQIENQLLKIVDLQILANLPIVQ